MADPAAPPRSVEEQVDALMDVTPDAPTQDRACLFYSRDRYPSSR